MIKIYQDAAGSGFEWIDAVAPNDGEIREIASKYNLHSTSVRDCLQPEHLPKYEHIGDIIFIILRVYDPEASKDADTIQELTNKIAIFHSGKFIITIHRHEYPFLEEIKQKYVDNGHCKSTFDVLHRIVKTSLITFEQPTRDISADFDRYESDIFLHSKTPELLKDLYLTKRKAAAFSRVLHLSRGIIDNLRGNISDPLHQDLGELHLSLLTICEPIMDSVTHLLNIYISLSAQKTNEVVRILTLFSVFFMPLTFIVGIYGMNFDFMPELRARFGYPAVLLAMAVVSLLIYSWFKRKGWL